MRRYLIFVSTLPLLAWSLALADESPPRQVHVSGTASVSAAPDQAVVQFGIQSRQASLAAAREQVSRVAGRFLALARKLGIPEQKVQSSALTVRPEYRWDKDGQEQQFAGYYVQRSLRVELDKLDLLGELIEGAVDAGVNEVSPPQLDSSRGRALHREALEQAAADARANAEVLARSLDAQLGPVAQISASEVGRPPTPVLMRAQALESADASATYQAGEIRFEARVDASFYLQ